jgi:uncharacterized membrane protein
MTDVEQGHARAQARAEDRAGRFTRARETRPPIRHRGLLAALACAGLAVATYLTLYQLRLYDSLSDPFDAKKVVDATYPIPDALAGVGAYAAELILLADAGRRLRWASPALGAILVAGALTSIALIVIQPTLIGAWCGWCLLSAALSLALFALGSDEVKAAAAVLRRTAQKRHETV